MHGMPRVSKILEHRIGEDHVKARVGERQRVDIARTEEEIRVSSLLGVGSNSGALLRFLVKPNDLSRHHGCGQAYGDRARSTPAIQHRHPGPEVGQEKSRTPFCIPEAHEVEGALFMADAVCRPCMFVHNRTS
jgi:hypothetical protein